MPWNWVRCRWSTFQDYCDVHNREIVPGCVSAALDQVDALLKDNARLREENAAVAAAVRERADLMRYFEFLKKLGRDEAWRDLSERTSAPGVSDGRR